MVVARIAPLRKHRLNFWISPTRTTECLMSLGERPSALSIGFTASPTESLLTAQYKIQQVLNTVQEPDDGPNKSGDMIVHSRNQFREFQHDGGIPLHPLYRAISNGEFKVWPSDPLSESSG